MDKRVYYYAMAVIGGRIVKTGLCTSAEICKAIVSQIKGEWKIFTVTR